MVYRGTEPKMPGYAHEWKAALGQGVRAEWQTLPFAFEADATGKRVQRVKCHRVDADKRPIAGSEVTLDADLVLLAIGQSKLGAMLGALAGIEISRGRGRHRRGRAHRPQEVVRRRRRQERRKRSGQRGGRGQGRGRAPSTRSSQESAMPDLSTNCAGIRSPNPFWLASAPPANSGAQIQRAFDAGWGGAVWKTLGQPIQNVSEPLRRHHHPRRPGGGVQQHRADHRSLARDELPRDLRHQEEVPEARRRGLAHGRDARRVARHHQALDRRRRRRARAELRVSARHVRARHGPRPSGRSRA